MFPKEAQEAVFTEAREAHADAVADVLSQSEPFLPADSTLERNLKGEDKQRYAELKKELAKYDQLKPAEPPVAEAMVDSGRIAPPTFLSRRAFGMPRSTRYSRVFSAILDPKPAADCSTADVILRADARRCELAC